MDRVWTNVGGERGNGACTACRNAPVATASTFAVVLLKNGIGTSAPSGFPEIR